MDKINEDLNAIINAINELEKIYIVTDLPTPENVISQLSLIKSSAIMLLNDMLDIDTAIKHCEEVAEQNETQADKIGRQLIGSAIDKYATDCRERAADHRRLADQEWLTELKEARRLPKAAVEGFEYIEKEALIKAIQEDYNNRKQEKYKEEIFKGLYSKVYCDGVEDEFKSVIKIIENMPYFVKGEICTTLKDGGRNE